MNEEDGLRAARGIMFGLKISVVLWAVLICIGVVIYRLIVR